MVPVTNADTAREILAFAQTKETGDLMFGVTAGKLKWYASEIRQATGIDFHSHSLRHTLATQLITRGIPIDVVQEVLGHQNINTTRCYAKPLQRGAAKVEQK